MASMADSSAALLRRNDDHRGHPGRDPESPGSGVDAGLYGDGQVRKGAWAADITGLLDLKDWRAGMRVIVREERPHPGAQLRFTDIDGHRFTCFATDARRGQLADLELRHRRRARCEDRIRNAKDTGLRTCPQGLRAEPGLVRDRRVGLRAAGLDADARPGRPARRWEPKRLRLRLFAIAGRLARSGRRLRLRLAERWPWAADITAAIARLQALPSANQPEQTRRPGRRNTRARGTPPTRRDSRAAGHGRHPKINPSRTPQASRSRALISSRLGFRQSSFNHIARVPSARRPYASARPLVSWHALVPFTFQIQVSHQTREYPPNSPRLHRGYDRAPRGAGWALVWSWLTDRARPFGVRY